MGIPRVKTWSCKAKSATGRVVSEIEISAPTKILARLNLAHEESRWLAWAIQAPIVDRVTFSAKR